jgi:hypothetical protein
MGPLADAECRFSDQVSLHSVLGRLVDETIQDGIQWLNHHSKPPLVIPAGLPRKLYEEHAVLAREFSLHLNHSVNDPLNLISVGEFLVAQRTQRQHPDWNHFLGACAVYGETLRQHLTQRLYAYVGNHPVDYIDPTGSCATGGSEPRWVVDGPGICVGGIWWRYAEHSCPNNRKQSSGYV